MAVVSSRTIVILIAVGLVLMVALRIVSLFYGNESTLAYHVKMGHIDIDSPLRTLWNFISGVFEDMGYRTQTIIESVPEKIGHTYGKSVFFVFYSMLPGPQVNPGIMLNHQLFEGSVSDVAYPPTMIAQLYMDFGQIGLAVGALIVGFVYQYFYIKVKHGYNPFFILVYIIMTYNLLVSSYGEFLMFDLVKLFVLYALYRWYRSFATAWRQKACGHSSRA